MLQYNSSGLTLFHQQALDTLLKQFFQATSNLCLSEGDIGWIKLASLTKISELRSTYLLLDASCLCAKTRLLDIWTVIMILAVIWYVNTLQVGTGLPVPAGIPDPTRTWVLVRYPRVRDVLPMILRDFEAIWNVFIFSFKYYLRWNNLGVKCENHILLVAYTE